ncbi:hypothetical protein TUBRATIS_11520 [Tubulinosema ratisbonensis]|uniref:Uncharacterized protein n=1 Tax=Tubulinosema ratisbonensis TaxID=291195 RepID=A0A437AMR3_9MICR|nr:hypothetical protein TUBRATIS_11520 [Tubulinosema ratisbonensis]
MNALVICGVIFMISLLVLIIYLVRIYIKKQTKKYLNLCIEALGEELESLLILNRSNTTNNLLHNYLTQKTEESFKNLCDKISSASYEYDSKHLTTPGFIMKVLLCELIKEQLKIRYNNGFMFCKYTFDNLKHIAPIVENYCIVYKMPFGNYFTNILEYKIHNNIVKLLKQNLVNYFIKNVIGFFFECEEVNLPKKVIVLYHNPEETMDPYHSRSMKLNSPQDFSQYKLSSMVIKCTHNDYEIIKGLNVENQSPETIRENYKIYTNSSLALGIFEKRT